MKVIATLLITLFTLSLSIRVEAAHGKKGRMTVSLESRMESNGVSLVLHDDQIGVYHHFILEKSLDGKTFFEVARTEEWKDQQGSRTISFRDQPFERTSIQCVFYRIRAVDDLGWFDFTNTVSVMKKQPIAQQNQPELAGHTEGQF